MNCRGCCWASALRRKRILDALPQRWCTKLHSLSRGVSCLLAKHHRTPRNSFHDLVRQFTGWRPPVPQGTRTSSAPAKLVNSGYVFVRRDNHRPPLTPPYEGPFKVVEHIGKTFVLDLGNRQDTVDRLKPAFLDPVKPIEPAKRPPCGRPVAVVPTGVKLQDSAAKQTKSVRQVRLPGKYQNVLM